MERKPHLLNRTTRNLLPKYVVFFDTETHAEQTDERTQTLRLRLGHAKYCRVYPDGRISVRDSFDFTGRAAFNAWLVSKVGTRKEVYLVAHNIGFDVRITGTLKYLHEHGFNRTLLIDEGFKFIARYNRGRGRIVCINNQQLFATSLRRLGESIGEYKGAVDFDKVDDLSLLLYCRQDVQVMVRAWEVWLAFLVKHNLGSFKITAASSAFEAFRHRFLAHDVYIHTDKRAIALERESYHGGRVECFFIGAYRDGKVACLDVNSMYPAVMQEAVPIKLRKHYSRLTIPQFNALRHRFGYIVEATLLVEAPVLPVKNLDNRLIFPTGKIRGVFAKPELEYALQQGQLLDVHAMNVYDEAVIFDEYVHFFYRERQRYKGEGNTAFAYICKLLMNSLYGKFGQRQAEYVRIGTTTRIPDGIYKAALDSTGELRTIRIIDGIIERQEALMEAYNAFPAIASYITARARVLLDSLIQRAGRENVLYCDTDSLFTTSAGLEALADCLDDAALGKLKVEGIEEGITIRAPKSYTFGAKTVQKGIRRTATQIAPAYFEQEQFMGFTAALRASALEGVRITKIRKRLAHAYTKAVVTASGRVTPFVSPQFVHGEE